MPSLRLNITPVKAHSCAVGTCPDHRDPETNQRCHSGNLSWLTSALRPHTHIKYVPKDDHVLAANDRTPLSARKFTDGASVGRTEDLRRRRTYTLASDLNTRCLRHIAQQQKFADTDLS